MSYIDPYFSSKLDKMYSFDPFFDPCSVSSRRAVRSIPIQNLTEYPPPLNDIDNIVQDQRSLCTTHTLMLLIIRAKDRKN